MRHGLTIKEAPCPRCANKRTASMGSHGSICFNCRHKWEPTRTYAGFTAPELARLEIYRAAVRAGFYTDRL
jgi:hypothetical protein